jgi:hypothetical protein
MAAMKDAPSPPTREAELARVRELAQSLRALADEDFALLGDVKLSTTEAWRKRGVGPSYVRVGNRYFYPLAAVQSWMDAKTRERSSVAGALI